MKLYVYDHCPFCVKARAIFGLKDIPFELVVMLNDDEATPSRMIGKKMAPILEHEGRFIPESMDIVAYVDGLANDRVLAGPRNRLVEEWISKASETLYPLVMPRWSAAPFEEFSTPEARAYFIGKKEAVIGSFADRWAKSSQYIDSLNHQLQELDPLIQSADAVNGKLSEDDIHLFAAIRALSVVRGMIYPPKVAAYRVRMAERTGMNLHDKFAS